MTAPLLSPKSLSRLLDRYRVTSAKGFRLKHYDPADTADVKVGKARAAALLAEGVTQLAALQEKLAAQDRWAVLCVFQAIDAAGKDGTIKHVMSGVNPAGVQVTSFKVPGPDELSHDFLWRTSRALPQRGHIGIFNRSHYEEVLVARVHPEVLAKERLPPEKITKKLWRHRLEDIAAWERYLSHQGFVVLKFFLNVSKGEQKKRFLERLDDKEKTWKFSLADIRERGFWDSYQTAFEEAIAGTASPEAPWFVVPSDNKWFGHLVVVGAIIEALHGLDLRVPEPTPEMLEALEQARKQLEAGG
jgi:PPK2 family polyphosphate:nucleotide phosphotransferase